MSHTPSDHPLQVVVRVLPLPLAIGTALITFKSLHEASKCARAVAAIAALR
jgi:hypothetical protein